MKYLLAIIFTVSLLVISPANSFAAVDDAALCNKTHINTAIGCIPFGDETAFIKFILGWAVGIGGGVAFLLIIVAGFQIMTSAGSPDRLKAGQELLGSAVGGLLLLILSVFILRIIGVDILGISGI